MRLDLARLRRLQLFDPMTDLKVPAGQSVYDPAVFGKYDRATQKVVSIRDDSGAWDVGFDELADAAKDHARDWPATIERDRYSLVLPLLQPGEGTCLDACTATPDPRARAHVEGLGYRYVPIDIDGDGTTVQREDVTDLTLADASVARIMSLDTLEHVERYPDALSEFFRVLVPGGVLIVHVPVYYFDRPTSAPLDPANDPWGHVRYFSARELVEEVAKAGFAVLRLQMQLDYGAAVCIGGKPVRASGAASAP
jgi:SAM-dependent methyltransferase